MSYYGDQLPLLSTSAHATKPPTGDPRSSRSIVSRLEKEEISISPKKIVPKFGTMTEFPSIVASGYFSPVQRMLLTMVAKIVSDDWRRGRYAQERGSGGELVDEEAGPMLFGELAIDGRLQQRFVCAALVERVVVDFHIEAEAADIDHSEPDLVRQSEWRLAADRTALRHQRGAHSHDF